MTSSTITAVGLVSATVIGVVLALSPSIQRPGSSDPTAVVTVNGHPIEQSELDRALVAVANDKRSPITQEDEDRVLARLIEQELLVQRGIEIGLVEQDRNVRNTIVASVVDHVLKPTQSDPLDEADIRAWYEENADFFRSQPQMRLESLTQDGALSVPNSLLPVSTLSNYLGPTAIETALQTPVGETFTASSGDMFMVAALRPSTVPDYASNISDIEFAYRRALGDQAFRDYLDWLETRAEIEQ